MSAPVARLNRRSQEVAREKIRASMLINRLEDHSLGEVEMSSTQVQAALGLLKKCVPDLTATTISDPDGDPVSLAVAFVAKHTG